MSNLKKFVPFFIEWEGNGTDDKVVVDFAIDPVSYNPSTGSLVSSLFSTLPSGVDGVTVGGATLASESYNSTTHQLTVIFTSAPANGALGNISGNALFN